MQVWNRTIGTKVSLYTFGQPCYKSRQNRKLKLKISNA